MADLKTNYVDDILNASVNDKRKYQMIQNSDGTVSFNDVTTYAQNGDTFGAKDINDTNTAVNELNNNLIASDRTPFRFGVNENGEYGYIITDSEGADSVVPFKSDPKIETISGLTFRRQVEDTSLPVSVDGRVTPHSVISSVSKRFKIDISSTGLTEIYGASIYQDTSWQTMHFWGTYIDNNTVYVDFYGVCTNYGTITATLTLIGK